MNYDPKKGWFGNLQMAFAGLNKTNREVFNTQSDVQTIRHHQTEQEAALEEQLAESDAVALALYEAQTAQESVIAEHDEAILGIYEMIGG